MLLLTVLSVLFVRFKHAFQTFIVRPMSGNVRANYPCQQAGNCQVFVALCALEIQQFEEIGLGFFSDMRHERSIQFHSIWPGSPNRTDGDSRCGQEPPTASPTVYQEKSPDEPGKAFTKGGGEFAGETNKTLRRSARGLKKKAIRGDGKSSNLPKRFHAACSGYKSPYSEISGYLAMMALAASLLTSRLPLLIMLTKLGWQFIILLAPARPPASFTNLSNSIFMTLIVTFRDLYANKKRNQGKFSGLYSLHYSYNVSGLTINRCLECPPQLNQRRAA